MLNAGQMWDGILINISKPSLISIFLARNTMIKPVIKLSLHFCSSYKFVRKDITIHRRCDKTDAF